MTAKKILRLEGWGLILILASFLWQIIETDLQNMSQEVEYYKIHQKLDALWMLQSNEYANSPLNKSQVMNAIDFEYIFKNWKYYGADKKEYEPLNSQLKWAAIVRILIFVIGSGLLIVPKFVKQND